MEKIHFDYSHAHPFFDHAELAEMNDSIRKAHHMLSGKTGDGNAYLGWLDLPQNYDRKEFARIEKAALGIQSDSDVLLVVGIGGSYLGARAAIDMLHGSFYNLWDKDEQKKPKIMFAGHHLSPAYLLDLQHYLEDKDVSINVISKSGTTTEPAIAFRMFSRFLEKKYGKEEAKSRIYVTTDKQKGALKTLADQEGYETFVIPDDIGGRYSVLTAVGLLPIAVSGISIKDMMNGALAASIDLNTPDLESNHAYQYAAIRNFFYRKGKMIELLANYDPRLATFSEWWKQLFGESEGKDGKGLFPASAHFTTDLHSFGQYIQEGHRHLFETVLTIDNPDRDIIIEADEQNLDQLNYLAGKSLDTINKKAMEASIAAHTTGNVPNLIIHIPELTAYHTGYLFYFFEKACAVSGYLLGVNPFDQPGVEAYKTNMFRLLEKPGYKK